MRQEYLINGREEKTIILAHRFELEQKDDINEDLKIIRDIYEIPDAEAWIFAYSMKSNSEEAAKILSRVDEWVLKNSQAIILTNESSAYFNRILFPLINDFERSLRKLLYLMSTKHNDNSYVQDIKKLEEKDFGFIFNFLFCDNEFTEKVRQIIKKKNRNFTKREILKDIETIDELIVWDRLVGKELVPSLSLNFIEVKDGRNHVMHAHNIDYKTFSDIRKLYNKINKEIEDAIAQVAGKQIVIPIHFNKILGTILDVDLDEDEYERVSTNLQKLLEIALSTTFEQQSQLRFSVKKELSCDENNENDDNSDKK